VVGVEQREGDDAAGRDERKAVRAEQLDLVRMPEVDEAGQTQSTEDGHIGVAEAVERARPEQQPGPHPPTVRGEQTAEVARVRRLLQPQRHSPSPAEP